MDIKRIKLEGQIEALSRAINSKQFALKDVWDNTQANGRYTSLGVGIGKARAILDSIEELLTALKQLDGKAS